MSFLIKIDERRARFCGLMDIGTQTSPSKGGNKSEGKIVSRIISANKVDVEFARNRPSTSGRDERAINPCSPRAQDTHNTPRIVLSFKIVTWKKKNFFSTFVIIINRTRQVFLTELNRSAAISCRSA